MIATLATYRRISADISKALARAGADPLVKSDVAYLRKALPKVESAQALMKDDRLFKIAMQAFGLGDMAYAKGLMRQVLDQGTSGSGALANKLSDKRFLAFAKAFDFGAYGATTTRRSGFAQDVEARFLRESLESKAGESDENVRLALYFQRNAANVSDSYGLLADPALRKVAEVVFALPAASSGGNASNKRKPVTNCAHTKNGNRIHVMPGARSWMMVAMKFTAPNSDEVISKTNPTSKNACPYVGIVDASGE